MLENMDRRDISRSELFSNLIYKAVKEMTRAGGYSENDVSIRTQKVSDILKKELSLDHSLKIISLGYFSIQQTILLGAEQNNGYRIFFIISNGGELEKKDCYHPSNYSDSYIPIAGQLP